MRRLALLAFVAPLVAGCGWFGGWSPYPQQSLHTRHASMTVVAPPFAGVEVRHWMKVEHLPTQARSGARLFAISGCAACHTYAAVRTSERRT